MFDRLKESFRELTDRSAEAVEEREGIEKVTHTTIAAEDLDDVFEKTRITLLKQNVALDVVDALFADMQETLIGKKVKRGNVEGAVREALEDALNDLFATERINLPAFIRERETPVTILFMGFNGSGKTTTIAKVAHALKNEFGVVLAAGDTFRAASIEQLQEHAEKLDLPVITQEYESDPAAVIYDAKEYAANHDLDVVLGDTAGRSHANTNLMNELEKIVRVNEPDLKILVVDALVGNDVVTQAEAYEEIGFDAIIITKADVDEKGGAALSLAGLTDAPILYLGTGQEYNDLEEFDPDAFIQDLLA